MPNSIDDTLMTYDVCLSFADEQRSYVEEVAALLTHVGLRVFYDSFETANLWGRDLYEYLDEIYSRQSKFCILFISADYYRKVWTNHERASAQERALNSTDAYLLPVRFDETRIPGIRSTVGYIDAKQTSPAELVAYALSKMGRDNQNVGTAASVLALAAENPPGDCEASLRAVIEKHSTHTDISYRSYPDGTTVGVIPTSVISLHDVFTSIVPTLDKAVSHPGSRARIVLHRGEIPSAHGLNSVDVTNTVSAARALTRSLPVAGRHATCVVATSHRAHTELVRYGGVVASGFRKADPTGDVTPWDVYVRIDREPEPDAEPLGKAASVSNTVHHVTADNVVFGIQVTRR